MTEQQIYELWAPIDRPWSPWAKPVLFTELRYRVGGGAVPPLGADWSNVADLAAARLALVLDLPGERAVRAGLQLAGAGFQPVPLFNTSYGSNAVVPVGGIVDELRRGAEVLAAVALAPDAPPAFLLDSQRMQERGPALPGRYDNRWLVFPQDFPSAGFLAAQGIRGVVLLQDGTLRPQDDLAHVLLRWQEEGLSMLACHAQSGALEPEPITVDKPPHYRALWQQFLAVLGLRRNSAGGFGSIVPTPSQGGGFG